jgi:hypothetical protein
MSDRKDIYALVSSNDVLQIERLLTNLERLINVDTEGSPTTGSGTCVQIERQDRGSDKE